MEFSAKDLWKSVLNELQITLNSNPSFNAWIKTIQVGEIENNSLNLYFPTRFHLNKFQEQFALKVQEVIHNLSSGKINKINCKIQALKAQFPKEGLFAETTKIEPRPLPVSTPKTNLKSKYAFQTFVVGNHNRLAHAAAIACAEHPGEVYNPLFIYGGPGLGKTHLIQAIGNRVLESKKEAIVLYVTSEKFMNDFIQSLASGKIKEFKDSYRGVDVLLIDDVQFLIKKESTLDEFFHTFNTLYQDGKQIVITSDRPPKALNEMPERLISRFEGGMVVDIATPDLETRIAILISKCDEKGIKIENKILTFLAQNIEDNVRTLEGILNKIITLQTILKRTPTIDEVKSQIKEFDQRLRKKEISSLKILSIVSSYYKISTEDILGNKRLKEFVKPRQIVMYLMKYEASLSYPLIGREMRGKDHTTIIHGVKKIEKELDRDLILRREIKEIRELLYQ